MSLRFLIVDDTRFMRLMLTDILRKLDHEVVGEADNGERAIELYRACKPDIVFMDISMPGMDGVEALAHIRREDPDAVVVICSAVSQQDLVERAMAQGASGYVMKPFKPKQIREVIEKVKPAQPVQAEAKSQTVANGSGWMSKMQALLEKRDGTADPDSNGKNPGTSPGQDGLQPASANPASGRQAGPAWMEEPAMGIQSLRFETSRDVMPLDEAQQDDPHQVDAHQDSAHGEEAPLNDAQQVEAHPVVTMQPADGEETAPSLQDSLPQPENPALQPGGNGRTGPLFEPLAGCQWAEEAGGSGTVYRAWLAPGEPILEIACADNRIRLSVDTLARLAEWAKTQQGSSDQAAERLSG